MKNSDQLKSEKKLVLCVLMIIFIMINVFMLYFSFSKARTNIELVSSDIVNVINKDARNNSSMASSLGSMLQLSNSVIDKILDISIEDAINYPHYGTDNQTQARWNNMLDVEHRKKFLILHAFWRSFGREYKSKFSTYYTDGDSGYYYALDDDKVIKISENNPHFRLTNYLLNTAKELNDSHGFTVPELFYSNVYEDSHTHLPSITIGVPVVLNNFTSRASKVSGIIATDYTRKDLTTLFEDGFKKLNTKINGYEISIHSVKQNDIAMSISTHKNALPDLTVNHIKLTPGYYINTKIHLNMLINSRPEMFILSNLVMLFVFMLFLKAHNNSAMMMNKLTTDSLTQALSREGGKFVIENLSAGDSAVLVVIDLNDFKIINDTYGHHTGDDALVFFSRYVMKDLCDGDSLIRMGGDEFVLLLRNVAVGHVEDKMARLAKGLSSFPHEGYDIPLTFSYGISLFIDDFTDCYKKADENLYQMKRVHHATKA
ncbi:GGDEF domain-containing protein [Scandinavium sp. TWS1a]|uniref:GGDEF domain-containing protein n=1 Tax=Scandinavium tedordense TaxID=2926521 RepID=UPI002165E669|nr:GGDEF domain-containing protein [Scandinavium tedordense]MCS2170545.1 GGDEF domain-containing protein [Scandinavium tedordense]